MEQEREVSRKAFLMRVPTAIAYDVVKCDDCYGVVYELLDARTMAQFIDRDPGCIPEIGRKSAELLRRLHRIVPDADSGLPNRKEKLLDWVDSLSEFITPNETDKIKGFIRSIPDRDTFLHGDFNSKKDLMCGVYFGLSDPGAIEAMTEKLSPYSQMITTFHATTMTGNRDMIRARVDHLLRGKLLPAIDQAQPLDF